METAFLFSVVLALIATGQACNIYGNERRSATLTQAGSGPAGFRRELPPPPSLLGSPAKIISEISAYFIPEEESDRTSPGFATYGSDPDHHFPDHHHLGHHERSDSDLDVAGTESKESNDISNILSQLGPNSANATEDGALVDHPQNDLQGVDGCCWKIKVDYTSGHGFYGPVKILRRTYGYYTMEPGLVNGKAHYTSSDPGNEGLYALSFCGDSWWIQPASFRGQCKGFAHSGWHTDDCVTDIAYSWVYYVSSINQFVTAKKAMSTWCHV